MKDDQFMEDNRNCVVWREDLLGILASFREENSRRTKMNISGQGESLKGWEIRLEST
jgi:hypothetical protein